MDEKLLEVLGAAGYPTTMVGGLLLLFFYLRKAEAGMRNEINGSLVRLQKEKQELQAEVALLEAEGRAKEKIFDELRAERRDAQDEAHRQERRAELAEAKLLRAEAKLERIQPTEGKQDLGL